MRTLLLLLAVLLVMPVSAARADDADAKADARRLNAWASASRRMQNESLSSTTRSKDSRRPF